jgi:predicted Zn-dependent protease
MSMPSDPTIYQGSLGDGRTAASTPVEVRCTEAGLAISVADARASAFVWPYRELRSGVPLRADAADVLLSLRSPRSPTLFVASPAFIRALLARAAALSVTRQRLSGLRPGAIFVALVAAVVGTVWLLDYRPLLTTARLLPMSVRTTMGRNVIASITESRRICDAAPGRAALDRLTQRLAAGASQPPLPVRVVMVDWDLVNAFATPGGQLVLTRGLVTAAGSADEVAGVLAHEMGHAIELHPETGLLRAMAISLAAELLSAGTSNTSSVGAMLVYLRYSREAESQADAHAVRILRNAGIASKGFGDFFARIQGELGPSKPRKEKKNNGRVNDRLLSIVSTHPLTAARLAMVRSQPSYQATPALSDDDWQALRVMCVTDTSSKLQPDERPRAPERDRDEH